jgi:hypothetical protein
MVCYSFRWAMTKSSSKAIRCGFGGPVPRLMYFPFAFWDTHLDNGGGAQ